MKFYLREIRKNKNLSLRELEKRSGISKSEISAIENEQNVPKVDTLCSLAKALDVPITDLIECD